MDAHRGGVRIGTVCEVLGVSCSGYYALVKKKASQPA